MHSRISASSIGVRFTGKPLNWRAFFSMAARFAVIFLPTIASTIYYFAIASDQYESEAKFLVRSAARSETSTGLAFLVQLGLARSQDDSFVVQDFITSRDAIERLRHRMPLESMYHDRDADFLAKYPSVLYGPHSEEFHRYFQRMVSVAHSDKTGIATLRVKAFRPNDAHSIAKELLSQSEELVNKMNQRLLTDAVSLSSDQLISAQERLVAAQAALTDYRNRELLIDPTYNAVALADLISRLSVELANTRAQVSEMQQGTAGSPQLVGLQRKASAIEMEIAAERGKIAGDKGLAARIAAYEKLALEREFAGRLLTAAEAESARSRSEAARQLLYLERVVEPNLPDYALYPKRFEIVLMIFAFNALLMLIFWLVYSGVREHAAQRH